MIGAKPDSVRERRIAVFVLALVGAAISTYLTLYQWHVLGSVWDPFFGSASSERVLSSAVSRLAPLPDATLGAVAYLVEAGLAAIGGPGRAGTRPRLVLLYGVVLLALALTGLALVLSQLFLVRALCSLCLLSAGVSVVNALLGSGEVMAALSTLERAAT